VSESDLKDAAWKLGEYMAHKGAAEAAAATERRHYRRTRAHGVRELIPGIPRKLLICLVRMRGLEPPRTDFGRICAIRKMSVRPRDVGLEGASRRGSSDPGNWRAEPLRTDHSCETPYTETRWTHRRPNRAIGWKRPFGRSPSEAPNVNNATSLFSRRRRDLGQPKCPG
jgi:hypothetical protein